VRKRNEVEDAVRRWHENGKAHNNKAQTHRYVGSIGASHEGSYLDALERRRRALPRSQGPPLVMESYLASLSRSRERREWRVWPWRGRSVKQGSDPLASLSYLDTLSRPWGGISKDVVEGRGKLGRKGVAPERSFVGASEGKEFKSWLDSVNSYSSKYVTRSDRELESRPGKAFSSKRSGLLEALVGLLRLRARNSSKKGPEMNIPEPDASPSIDCHPKNDASGDAPLASLKNLPLEDSIASEREDSTPSDDKVPDPASAARQILQEEEDSTTAAIDPDEEEGPETARLTPSPGKASLDEELLAASVAGIIFALDALLDRLHTHDLS